MRRVLVVAFLLALAAAFSLAQEQGQGQDAQAVLKAFTRAGAAEGITFSFSLVNNRTVDTLFSGQGKYAIRARANQSTLLFLTGQMSSDGSVDRNFTVEQDGATIAATPINIQNFDGKPVIKGTRFDGLLQLEKKLDLAHPFTVRGLTTSVEFKLTEEALKLLAN